MFCEIIFSRIAYYRPPLRTLRTHYAFSSVDYAIQIYPHTCNLLGSIGPQFSVPIGILIRHNITVNNF